MSVWIYLVFTYIGVVAQYLEFICDDSGVLSVFKLFNSNVQVVLLLPFVSF